MSNWSFKKAIRNIFKWDKGDWIYLLWLLIILGLGFLYYSEVNICHVTLNNLSNTCDLYCQAKTNAIISGEEVNLTNIMWKVINNVSE